MIDIIEQILQSMAITGNYIGYQFAVFACEILCENRQHRLSVTRDIYDVVAKRFGCKTHNVERNIRTIISHAWKNTPERFSQLAGYALCTPPTVAQFLYMVSQQACKEHAALVDRTERDSL